MHRLSETPYERRGKSQYAWCYSCQDYTRHGWPGDYVYAAACRECGATWRWKPETGITLIPPHEAPYCEPSPSVGGD